MKRRHVRRALTLVETMAVVVVCFLLLAVLFFNRGCHGSRASDRQTKCATQVRSTVQEMIVFAQSNRDSFPLPSNLDANNQTVAERGRAKDTTNNILSILVFNRSITPELLLCPSESNSQIQADAAYQHKTPNAAVNPAAALWDPGLHCDFATGIGHISYATLMLNGDAAATKGASAKGRLCRWTTTVNTNEAVYGNRGPLVSGERDANGSVVFYKLSNTLAIHGGRTTWEGNIGYNDSHVDFEKRLDPLSATYLADDGKLKPDILFYGESDDSTGVNTWLGVWVKAGEKAGDYKGVHD